VLQLAWQKRSLVRVSEYGGTILRVDHSIALAGKLDEQIKERTDRKVVNHNGFERLYKIGI